MVRGRPTPEEVAARTLAIVDACRALNVGGANLSAEYIEGAIVADAIGAVVEMLDENTIELAARFADLERVLDRVADRLLTVAEGS